MTTNLANRVARDFLSYFAENLIVEERHEIGLVHTPFVLPDDTSISIGVSPAEGGQIALTDLAAVSNFFFTEGRSLEEEMSLRRAADTMASRFGVRLVLPEIQILTTADRLGLDALTFTQALISIAGLYDRRQRRAKPDFTTRVKALVSERIPQDLPLIMDHRITIALSEREAPDEVSYNVDAAVLYESPKFLQAVGSASAAYRVATVYHALTYHGLRFLGAIVYNEQSPGWADHYRTVLEDTPATFVVPSHRQDEVIGWLQEEAV
ncbi:MAG: hypothetical protein U9R79_09005 [Armatimonadota bacterium]|nr:hypothetical protein [Armatimonadota bacterium]